MTRAHTSKATALRLIGCVLVAPSLWSADMDSVLPLPQWPAAPPALSGTARVDAPPLGGFLFPEGGAIPDAPGPLTLVPPGASDTATEFQAARPDVDLSLFLPDALLGKTIRPFQNHSSATAGPLRGLSDDFLAACRESPREAHLIDPDNHVSETQKEDLLRFLQFHARDARTKAYVVVMDHDQEVPAKADLSSVASGALSSQDSCLAFYPLGDPWRARLFVSAPIHKIAAPDYLKGVVADCAKDASQATDPLEQLHRFTVRLSIRLFWLEKLIGADPASQASGSREKIPADLIAKREAALNEALLEQITPLSPIAIQWWSVVLGVLASLAGGAATDAALRYRRKRLLGFVWMLPEIDIPPRLGGAFSGGGGAWIQYR